jgi:hypothetical protein
MGMADVTVFFVAFDGTTVLVKNILFRAGYKKKLYFMEFML